MSDLTGLIDSIPINDIAKQLGIDPSVAKAAVNAAVPAIVGGLAANASDADGAKSLESALGNHAGKSTKLADVDTEDGKKIVKNVFGAKTDDVVKAAAKKDSGGVDLGPIIAQILPIIAPIVLAFIAQQMAGKKAAAPTPAPAATGGDLGSLLGGMLSDPSTQSMIGGLLGGLLGGGKK